MTPTIVLIHGAWMNPESWDAIKHRYEERGYTVLAPAWPEDDRSVAELRSQPDPALAQVGIPEIVNHYAEIIEHLDSPPILIGHSFGGLFVQMLLDRGLGVAGVAIDSAPPKGVSPSFHALQASLPALGPGAGHKIRTLDFDDFQWGWMHLQSAAEAQAAYDRYVVPTPGKIFVSLARAPFSQTTHVDFHNDTRAPLLLIAGSADRTVTAKMNKKNYHKYKHSDAITDFYMFEGRTHWLLAQPGWEEVADYAINWVESKLPHVEETED